MTVVEERLKYIEEVLETCTGKVGVQEGLETAAQLIGAQITIVKEQQNQITNTADEISNLNRRIEDLETDVKWLNNNVKTY